MTSMLSGFSRICWSLRVLVGVSALVLVLSACDSDDMPSSPGGGDDSPPQPEVRYELLVSSSRSNSVRRYDFDSGEYLGDFVAPMTGRLRDTQEVLRGPGESILVTGLETDRILQFDAESGEYLGPFTSGYELSGATKTTYGPDSLIYVSQWGQPQQKVVRFDGRTGEFVDEFTKTDVVQGMGHAWDGDGNLYVASMGEQAILRFKPDGTLDGTFAEAPSGMRPANIWFKGGKLYAVDWQNGNVKRFDGATGDYEGILLSGLERVEGYAWGPFGALILCDWQQGQVVRYSESGDRLNVVVDDPELRNPNGVLVRRVVVEPTE